MEVTYWVVSGMVWYVRCVIWACADVPFTLLRTNGVNTHGAAAKVLSFDRLGKKVRPGTIGKI